MLKCFLTVVSNSAPCVLFGSNEFWKCIDNHNRSNEREINKRKDSLHRKKVLNNSSQGQQTFAFAYICAKAVCECYLVEKLAQNMVCHIIKKCLLSL